MKNINEYDERQLKLMYQNLTNFEKKQIGLGSLVASLEFLLNALEIVDEEWEEKIVEQIVILETVNAIEIIKDTGETLSEISKDEQENLIKLAVLKLKDVIEKMLTRKSNE